MKSHMKFLLGLSVAAAIGFSSIAAQAAAILLTSDPALGTTTTFTVTGNNGFGNPGPVSINGITVTGNPQATYGDASYGLNGNGNWSGGFSWVATNNSNGSITFDLGGDYGLVGSFLNYAPGSGSDATITALNAANVVIDSFDLNLLASISTPGGTNAGAFRGIQSAGNDIRYFQLSGSYILAHTLERATPASIPEPLTLSIFSAGLVGAAALKRRKKAA